MKTIKNHKLLIDADCPMCKLYGNAFEANGLIEKGTCDAYQTIDRDNVKSVDMERAKNEIAFINTKTQEVVYGFDAFKKILTSAFPALKAFLNLFIIDFLGKKAYRFVSTNRKVIMPAKKAINDCSPTLNIKYRIFYMLLVALFSSMVIYQYSASINELMNWKSSFYRELSLCFGQIIWQTIFLIRILKIKIWDYLGNMMTVSLMGTFLLMPLLFLKLWLTISPIVYLVYFLVVVGLMLLEHLRRCKLLEIGLLPTVSWLAFRIFFLLLINFIL
jgi:hypothetical protein